MIFITVKVFFSCTTRQGNPKKFKKEIFYYEFNIFIEVQSNSKKFKKEFFYYASNILKKFKVY